MFCFFFFNDTSTTESYTYGHTLSLHDALPIYVDSFGRGRADRDDFAFLERAQQLGLQRQRHLGHFIEQQGAAVRGAEKALAPRRRAGEGALLVAEQQDRKSTRLNSSH